MPAGMQWRNLYLHRVAVASSGKRLQGMQVFHKIPLRWGESCGSYWGSSHILFTLKNKSKTELKANSLGRHLLSRQEKSLQDHTAMQYEQQSTEPALLKGPGCRLFGGARLGKNEQDRVKNVFRKRDAYTRLSWWRKGFKHVGEDKDGVTSLEVPKIHQIMEAY